MAYVKIYHPAIATTKLIMCDNFTVGGKKNIQAEPNANIASAVDVQTQSFENLKYTISGVHFLAGTSDFSYEDVLKIYRAQYNNSNPVELYVEYGNPSNKKYLVQYNSANTTVTKLTCCLESFNFPISMTDSRNGYMPIGSLIFCETL